MIQVGLVMKLKIDYSSDDTEDTLEQEKYGKKQRWEGGFGSACDCVCTCVRMRACC